MRPLFSISATRRKTMYGTESTMKFQRREMRLNAKMQKAIAEKDFRNIVSTRCAQLGYSYDDSDSGSGAALSSIASAAATLGSAYVISTIPNNTVSVPTKTVPAYGAATSTSSGLIFAVVA